MKYKHTVPPSFLSKFLQFYGSMDGLPRISMFMGTHDLLWPDFKKLCQQLEKKGVEFDYFEYPEMFHVWMALTMLPESRSVVKQIGELLREDLGDDFSSF